MTYTLGIVTHPQRLTYAEQLQAKTNADLIITDDGRGPGANHTRAWQELATLDTTWTVLLEDDCLPIINFCGQLAKALTVAPTGIVSLYLGKSRPPQHQTKIRDAVAKAHANDASWIITDKLFHAVAVAIRTDHITDMTTGLKAYLPIDEALSQRARQLGELIAYSHPSIVDHNDALPSLTRHRDRQPRRPGRVAWTLGTRTTWTTDSVTL